MKWIYHKRYCWRSVVKRIYSERIALVIYPQPVIYSETNHLLAGIHFDSNTQETTKRQVYPSHVSSFPPLHENKSRQELDTNKDIYVYFVSFKCEKTTLHRLTI